MEIPFKYNFYGDKEIIKNNKGNLGIVGSRVILPYTKYILEDLFEEIKHLDITIVSGGMYGVDIYSHNLALFYGMKTVVVLPQGIKSYFSSNLYSQLKIKKNSKILFLSEYSDFENPKKYTFLARNKIVVNLSDVLLVAQASSKSGSLFSANYALKNNKKLLSVPIGLDNPQFQGTNLLISKGSSIYLNPSSIMDLLEPRKTEDVSNEILRKISKLDSFTLENLVTSPESNVGNYEKGLLKLILEGKIFYSEGIYYKC